MAVQYDFKAFRNIEISGGSLSSFNDEELAVLYTHAKYTQAMVDADAETFREIVSEDKIFTHMSGKKQSREEFLSDIVRGRLNYHRIGIENPSVRVNGDRACVTCTSALTANAYGAVGTFHIKGTHHYQKRNGSWIQVNG